MHFCSSWIAQQSPELAISVFSGPGYLNQPINPQLQLLYLWTHVNYIWYLMYFSLNIFLMKHSSHAFWWLEEWMNSSLITLETQMLWWAGPEVRLHVSVGMTSEWVCCSLNLLFFSLFSLLENKWKIAVTLPISLLWRKWIPPWGRACGMMGSFYTRSPLTIQLILSSHRFV